MSKSSGGLVAMEEREGTGDDGGGRTREGKPGRWISGGEGKGEEGGDVKVNGGGEAAGETGSKGGRGESGKGGSSGGRCTSGLGGGESGSCISGSDSSDELDSSVSGIDGERSVERPPRESSESTEA